MGNGGQANPALEMQRRFADYVNHSFDRLRFVVTEAGAGRYTADKLSSDAVSSWIELTAAWLFPLGLTLDIINQTAVQQLPMDIKTTDREKDAVFNVPDLGVQLNPDVLTHTDGRSTIQPNNIVLTLTGRQLKVSLQNLQNIQQGVYSGNILRADNQNVFARLSVRAT